MKYIYKLIELEPRATGLLVLKTLIESNKWLGLKELFKISCYYPAVNGSINRFIENGMLIEKLEPYNCGRKNRRLWKVNKENEIIKMMEKEI